ncbi:MAG TPA: hypothetical protein VK196_07020 [Magnetospirillum sp.]|nr:hypothetical protein [Magnetospirillum sp.]
MRTLTVLIVVAAMAAGLSACGRKSRPEVPEGSTYPRHYPDITFPSGPQGQPPASPDAGTGTETLSR